MTVFVLTQAWDYEGEGLLGVYASLEAAQRAAEEYVSWAGPADLLVVYQLELGSPAQLRESVWDSSAWDSGEE